MNTEVVEHREVVVGSRDGVATGVIDIMAQLNPQTQRLEGDGFKENPVPVL